MGPANSPKREKGGEKQNNNINKMTVTSWTIHIRKASFQNPLAQPFQDSLFIFFAGSEKEKINISFLNLFIWQIIEH